MHSVNPSSPVTPSTRRSLIEAERSQRDKSQERPQRSRTGISGQSKSLTFAKAKTSAALLSVAALLATFALPAYASQETAVGPVKSPGQAQDFASPQASAAVAELARDAFSVTKPLPPATTPYSRIADTFANNPNSAISWPLMVGAPISSYFGWRTLRGASDFHTGLDINPGLGTPIQSIADGVVVEVGNLSWDAGVYVVVEHQVDGTAVRSLYAHMLEGSPTVVVGQQVTRGEQVGNVGCTGNCTGPHVHFEIVIDGAAIDPYPWMKTHVGS